jgi:uncharacterized protein (TIGR00251 family)
LGGNSTSPVRAGRAMREHRQSIYPVVMSGDRVVRSHPNGSLLTVWVVPRAKKTEIVGFHGDALRVRVTAIAEKGQANRAVIALLEEELGCRLRLSSGATSRRKRLLAVGISAEDLGHRVDEVGS